MLLLLLLILITVHIITNGGFYTWGYPKSSILMGFCIINHPFRGTPIYGHPHIDLKHVETISQWQHWVPVLVEQGIIDGNLTKPWQPGKPGRGRKCRKCRKFVNEDIWQHKQRWISLASSSFSMTAIFFSFCSCPWNHLTVNHAQTSHCTGGFWFRDQSPAECNSARWSCRRLKTRSKLWPQQDRNPSTGLSSHPALRSDADGRARPELVQIYPQHGTSQNKHKRISFSVSDWPYL